LVNGSVIALPPLAHRARCRSLSAATKLSGE
jgi:hypothetical protein